jgi:hypothetical protein
MRKTQLKRKTPLKRRTPLRAKKPMNKISKKMIAQKRAEKKLTQELLTESNGVCKI